jgi:hypothetical protein
VIREVVVLVPPNHSIFVDADDRADRQKPHFSHRAMRLSFSVMSKAMVNWFAMSFAMLKIRFPSRYLGGSVMRWIRFIGYYGVVLEA